MHKPFFRLTHEQRLAKAQELLRLPNPAPLIANLMAAASSCVDAAQAAGGVAYDKMGGYELAGDDEWPDLASAVVDTHRSLIAAGVQSELTMLDKDPEDED